MRIIFRLILVTLILFACNVPKDLSNRTFKYKSKKRTMQLVFENDSICKLENIFHCNDVESEIKELITFCKYRRNGDTIFLKNNNCKNSDCNYNLIRNIPPQKSKQCTFLNLEKRTSKKTIGPSYITDYQKYGLVPNIDIDTLYIVKNKIILLKEDDHMSILFFFK